ncbi:hypothetical protein KUF71_009002 [Frankliniella fusca]|uniref:Uncharacterized protein n=1 Tax=Frankliniella fusca TaxID=407009 RepID=A0AAE1I2E8_9NEOP|nr:hypothetical protein KUF71_009002 [Frankliniella fusca]
MKTLCRCLVWVVLAMRLVRSAPLDQQKIYFPGDSPDQDVESRINGKQTIFKPLPQYETEEEGLGRNAGWSENNMQNGDGPIGQPQMLPHGGGGYGLMNGLTSNYQKGEWGQDSLSAGPAAISNPYGIARGTHYQYSAGAHDTENYPPVVPHQQGGIYSLGNGAFNGEQKIRKHTWSTQYSGETERLQHEPHQAVPTSGNNGLSAVHEQTFSSSNYHNNPEELISILDGQSSHRLHPNIKEALNRVINDYGEASGEAFAQPSHHKVHKISHVKKTTVQNVGKEPTYIQSTSSNDDINLSELIEQLQMLEQSPRHINITWCEEKIKEFLSELRRKQASGIYINQKVQEQTLHQILTHETSIENDRGVGVYEPPMTRVTIKPLGGEDMSKDGSDLIKNEQSHVSEVSADQTQEESSNHMKQVHEPHPSEILTAIPPAFPHKPEVMSHHYEQPKEAPPFISDNSSDLKDLELELPEYVPFEHSHSGGTYSFEGGNHMETRPISHPSAEVQSQGEISTAQESNENLPKTIDGEQQKQGAHEEILEQMNEGHHTLSEENTGSLQMNHEEISTDHHHISSGNSAADHTNTGELKNTLTYEIPQQQSKEESHRDEESESTHKIHGRPQAPQDEVTGSHRDNLKQTEESEQLVNAGEIPKNEYGHETSIHTSQEEHHISSHEHTSTHIENLHHQQVNYDNLIEELIQLESIPGHQAIDKCEEKIQEFLEILKYQQEQGFGRNQQELQRLHQTLIQQAQERSKQLSTAEDTTSSPVSFWRKVQKKIKKTYQSAKDKAKEAMG